MKALLRQGLEGLGARERICGFCLWEGPSVLNCDHKRMDGHQFRELKMSWRSWGITAP